MKRKNLIILCFSALLLLVAVLGGIKEYEWNKPHSISVDVVSEGGVENVKLWMGPGEMYYLFLPGYADLSQTQIRCNVLGNISLDYRRVTDKMDGTILNLEEPMVLIHDPCTSMCGREIWTISTR